MADNISMYRFTETSKKWIRGVYGDHGNDFLSLASWYNDDRDMTGSFRIEIATDQFKMRVFDGYSNQKFNLNSRNFYSYQSIFFGGEGYTPYEIQLFLIQALQWILTIDLMQHFNMSEGQNFG